MSSETPLMEKFQVAEITKKTPLYLHTTALGWIKGRNA